ERFCPELRCVALHGKDRHEAASSLDEYDWVIAPYSLLQRDRDRWLEAQWHLVVLDEAQNIKNASTHAAQVVGQLQTRHRLRLSGTPMDNHLGEMWVVKLVAQGTIEERILALQERKAALGESIYSGAAGRKQPLFTEDDLAELLRPLSD
ncbi:MAG: SNF2-related protein, partial [Rhodoferax sp.]